MCWRGSPTGSRELLADLIAAPPAEAVTGYQFYRDGVFLLASGGPTTLGSFTAGKSVTLTARALNATGEGPDSDSATDTAG